MKKDSYNFENTSGTDNIRLIKGYHYIIAQLKKENLEFTLNETKEYFSCLEISLPPKEIKNIHTDVGGNPLGIHLVSESIKRSGYKRNETISKVKMKVFKWMDDKLFSRYSCDVQDMFIRFSLFESFPKELLQYISGDLWDKLEDELECNPFCQKYSYMSEYKINPMFLEYLTTRQKRLKKETIYEVYVTAAEWSLKKGMKHTALTYYNRAKRYDNIWNIIFRDGMERRSRDEADFLINLIDSFPPDFIERNPMSSVVRASLFYNNYELSYAKEALEGLLEKWESKPDTDENRAFLGEIYILLGLISISLRTQDFIVYFKKADTLLPGKSTYFGNKYKFVDINTVIEYANPSPGGVKKFTEALSEALPYITRTMHGCGYGSDFLASAEACYYKGEISSATQYAYKAVYMAREQDQGDIVCSGYFLLTQIGLAMGNYKMFRDALTHLKGYGEKHTEFLDVAAVGEAWACSAFDHNKKIAGLSLADIPPISIGRNRLIELSALMWRGDFYEALALTDVLKELYKQRASFLCLLSVYISMSISYYYLKKYDTSIAVLEDAYKLSEGNKLYMPFITSGKHMRSLINNAKRRGGHNIPESWLDSIYSKANTFAKRVSLIAKENGKNKELMADDKSSLSAREKTLLIYLSEGLTRDEIADSMSISINTVKSMLKSIYSKLGAINRADAVRIAKDMDII